MSSGLLPASLLCAATALSLARGSPGGIAAGVAALALGALAGGLLLDGQAPASPARFAAWASLVLSAGMTVLGSRVRAWPWRLLLAANAGVWAGAATGLRVDLAAALGWLLLAGPAYALVRSRGEIAARVAASWLLTIGLLNAALPLTTPTPGYVRDHME